MLDHVRIPVSNFERGKRFYEQALSPLGYELIMEPRYGVAGLGHAASRTSGSSKGSRATPQSTWPSSPTTVRQWRLSTRRPSRRAGATTVVGGFAPSTIRPSLGPLYLIRMATTSKRSAMGQE